MHDSGLERAHVADVAESVGVPFAEIGPATRAGSPRLLDAGLVPANPLDVWGTGADTRDLFGGSLLALAEDPAVEAVALAVDLVHELDGDDSYPLAMLDVAERTREAARRAQQPAQRHRHRAGQAAARARACRCWRGRGPACWP